MKECDILRESKHTLTLPTYFEFSRVRTPAPRIYAPGEPSELYRPLIVGRTACEPWSMRTVDSGSPAPTFWSFVLASITLSSVEQQRHWLEDTVCLELIRHKDGSIVSISRISEVIVSNCSPLTLWNLQLYNNSFEWKNVTFYYFRGFKTYSDASYILSGVRTPNLQDLRPWHRLSSRVFTP